jgi:hypothetical protein
MPLPVFPFLDASGDCSTPGFERQFLKDGCAPPWAHSLFFLLFSRETAKTLVWITLFDL